MATRARRGRRAIRTVVELGALMGGLSSLMCSSSDGSVPGAAAGVGADAGAESGGDDHTAGGHGGAAAGKAGARGTEHGGDAAGGSSQAGEGGADDNAETGASGSTPSDGGRGRQPLAGGAGAGGAGAGGAGAGGAGGTGSSGGCLSPSFQWIDAPTGWVLRAANVFVSRDGCVVVGYLSSSADTTFAPKGIFRWTEAGGIEILSGSEGLVPRGVSQDGSLIIASPSASAASSSWTRAQGWVVNPNGRTAYVVNADGSALAGGCASSACYWKGGVLDAILAPPPAPDGTLGSHVGVNTSQISADGATVAGEAILWDSTHPGIVINYVWTKPGGTQRVAIPKPDDLSVALSANGAVLATQQHAYTLSNGAIVGTRTLSPPSSPFQNPRLWAIAMSDDAATFVGAFEPSSGSPAGAQEAYLSQDGASWSPASMADRLIAHGVQLNGDRLHRALDTSADGSVVVGLSTNEKRVWLATAAAFN